MCEGSSAGEEYLKRVAIQAGFHPGVMAELMEMNQRQLHRMIRRQQGCSPQKWLEEQRLKLAESELRAGKSLEEVAADIGFCRAQSLRQWLCRMKGGFQNGPEAGI